MAGRNINVSITNWQATGSTAPVPQYTVDVVLDWIDSDGQAAQHSNTYTFPNVLAGVPLSRLRRYMERIILEEARLMLEIDEARP